VVFYVFFEVVTASREHQWFLLNYVQALWMHWMFLGVVVSMVLLGSIVFAAPSSNASICIVLVLGILLVGRYLGQIALQYPEPKRSIIYAIYFIIPHLEWFDLREMVIHERRLVSWAACGWASLYAAAYTAFFLLATWILFRRKALNN
jgi:hypothetical protein